MSSIMFWSDVDVRACPRRLRSPGWWKRRTIVNGDVLAILRACPTSLSLHWRRVLEVCRTLPSTQLCVGYADMDVNPMRIPDITSVCWVKFVLECRSQRKTFVFVQQYGFYSWSAETNFNSAFALELMIDWSLVAAAHAMDNRHRKTVFALEVWTPVYSNMSQLSKGSTFTKRACLTMACRGASPWSCCGWLLPRFRRHRSQEYEANIRRRQFIRPEVRYLHLMQERRYG